jgi:hypothetical protein
VKLQLARGLAIKSSPIHGQRLLSPPILQTTTQDRGVHGEKITTPKLVVERIEDAADLRSE